MDESKAVERFHKKLGKKYDNALERMEDEKLFLQLRKGIFAWQRPNKGSLDVFKAFRVQMNFVE